MPASKGGSWSGSTGSPTKGLRGMFFCGNVERVSDPSLQGGHSSVQGSVKKKNQTRKKSLLPFVIFAFLVVKNS